MKRTNLNVLFISVLLVTITPVLIPDMPIEVSQGLYKYELGYPIYFIEQEVGIFASHIVLKPEDVVSILHNPLEIPFQFLIINYVLSVITLALIMYLIFFLYKNVKRLILS